CLGLAALTVGAIAACSSSDGGTPTGGGGSPGTGGAKSGGAGGVPGTGGGATAGTNATAGTTATGGAGGAPGFACSGGKLTNPLITSFTNPTASGVDFKLMDGVPGGTFSY